MDEPTADRRPYALVVDDDALILLDASAILEDAGFRVFEASDAEQALTILRVHHRGIVLLFTDVEMPGPMNGFELARETARSWPFIGILVASGRRSPSLDDLPDGAHFVGKPFSAEVVDHRLKQLLDDGQKPEPLKD